MDFIAFSDFHGMEYNYENAKTTVNEILESVKVEFIVVCGDLTTRGSVEAAQSLLRLADFPVTTYFIFGNMDYFDKIDQHMDKAINLHLNPVKLADNCDLVGIGGDKHNIKRDINVAKEIINDLEAELLILVSHVAPFMHCDLAFNDRHIGSKHLTDLINDIQKDKKVLVCCGHIHEQWKCHAKLGNADIWNIGPKGILFEIIDSEINAEVL